MKNNLLKFGLLVLLAVFTFHSCSDDEQVISPKSVDLIKIRIEDEIENIELENRLNHEIENINYLLEPYKSDEINARMDSANTLQQFNINTKAFSVIENENGKSSYTFEVEMPGESIVNEIVNLNLYYNANNELKASLIGYNLTHEEMQTAISNQSFDGFWDKIYYLDLEEIEIIEATPKSNKVSARRRTNHGCDGIFNCDANGSNRWTRYGNNSGYGGYSGSGSSYSLPPLSNLPPQVAAALQAAGVFLGVNYNNRAPAGYGYNYTSPVRYFSVGDLTIPNTNSNSTPTPFNRRYFYYFPELKNKITTYYNQVYVSYINSYVTSTQTTLEDHNNKQRFITQFFKFLYKLRTENYSAFNYLANNPQKMVAVFNFLAENNSFNAYEFAKSAIDILSLPVITSNNKIDYAEEILRLTNHLKSFGNIEDEIYADYIQSLIPEFNSMTINEVRAIYGHVKTTCNNLTIKYLKEIITPIVTDLVIPVITYALFEATAGTAVKLLQKIPLPLVLRGVRLNKMVIQLTKIGVQGDKPFTTIIKTNTPISKARELFLSVTKNAISKSTQPNGAIVANMGNGNFITYRTVSSTGFEATIDLNFPALFNNVKQVIKFTK